MTEHKPEMVDIKRASTKMVAEIMDCSPTHIRNLRKVGELHETARGKYDLREVGKYMLKNSRENMSEFQRAKLENEREKIRRQKIQNDEADGLLVPIEETQVFVHGYTTKMIQYLEAAKKSAGAHLDPKTRKKFYQKIADSRAELAHELETYKDNSV